MIALALLAPAACVAEPAAKREEPPESATDPSAMPAPQPPGRSQEIRASEDLFGQWRLAAMTGADLAGHHPIHLLVGRQRVEAVSQCIPFDFRLPFADEPPPPPPARPGEPEGMCARALSPVEQLFPQVMQAARRVERREGGRVAFVGARGEALFERPAAPVLNPFENQPGPGPTVMWGEWRAAAIDGRPLTAAEPLRLLFGRRSIEAMSGCVSMLWRYSQQGERLALERVPWPGAVCERALQPSETALQTIMSGEVRIARSTPRERLIVGRGGSVLLRR